MKIDGPRRTNEIDAIRTRQPTGNTRTPAQRGDTVHVSKEAELLATARGPEVPDSARIERLREAVEQGTLHVDADVIAHRMLNEEG